MKNKKTDENQIDKNNYSLQPVKPYMWPILICLLLFIGLFTTFPLKEFMLNLVKAQIKSKISCPINYKKIDLEVLWPKIIFKDLNISSKCLNFTDDFKFNDLVIGIRGPSFYPIGIKTNVFAKSRNGNINLGATFSFTKMTIKIFDSEIDLYEITSKMKSFPKLSGDLFIKSLVTLTYDKVIKDISLLLRTNNLNIPPQNIHGFDLPPIPLNNFMIKSFSEDESKVSIPQLTLGNDKAFIIASFMGTMHLSPHNILNSDLSLSGEAKFSDEFLNRFSILKLFLKKYSRKGEFYQIKIEGPLTSPRASPAKN